MLALTLRREDEITIDVPGEPRTKVVVAVLDIRPARVTIGITAPKHMRIERVPDETGSPVNGTPEVPGTGPSSSSPASVSVGPPIDQARSAPVRVVGPPPAPAALAIDCAAAQPGPGRGTVRHICGRFVDLVVVLGLMFVTAVAPFVVSDWARSEGLMR